jgi:hypothetical protein
MTFISNNKEDFVISPSHKPDNKVFPIVPPAIESGYVYHFTSGSGLLYEVRFAPKANNILEMVVNFTVIGDEFELDYPVTNRGEVYSIIATVIEIMKMFHRLHNFTISYEFSGDFKENEDKVQHDASIRSRLYLRYAAKILNHNWKPEISGNKVILKKIK